MLSFAEHFLLVATRFCFCFNNRKSSVKIGNLLPPFSLLFIEKANTAICYEEIIAYFWKRLASKYAPAFLCLCAYLSACVFLQRRKDREAWKWRHEGKTKRTHVLGYYVAFEKRHTMRVLLSYIIYLLSISSAFGQPSPQLDYLAVAVDTINDEYGYRNLDGEMIIPYGKYGICYTDKFQNYAIVLKKGRGLIAIDRNENELYQVLVFENCPDDFSEGLFRIVIDGKIGYADSISGKIVIEPKFECARPFQNGIAKVSNHCEERPSGEYKVWVSNSWYFIDKLGVAIKK